MKNFWVSGLLVLSLFSQGVAQEAIPTKSATVVGTAYFLPFYHWPVAFSDQEGTITIEDGSVWKIDQYRDIWDWRRNDPLTITVSTSWFLETHYSITNGNERSHPSVKATLLRAPLLNAPYSRQIVSIDAADCMITLTDQSRWQLTYSDFYACRNWTIGDYMIVAYHSSGNGYVLVNTNMNEWVKTSLKGWIYGIVAN